MSENNKRNQKHLTLILMQIKLNINLHVCLVIFYLNLNIADAFNLPCYYMGVILFRGTLYAVRAYDRFVISPNISLETFKIRL